MAQTPCCGLAEGLESFFLPAVFRVCCDPKGLSEEDLLGLRLGDDMLVRALPRVANIPVEARDPLQLHHSAYIAVIYTMVKPVGG